MNEYIIGNIDYSELRNIIFNYFKVNKGIELESISIDYLRDKLAYDKNSYPFFIKKDKYGETRFDISKEDIQKILSVYLATQGFELSNVEFGEKITLNYKQNSEIDSKKLENVELNLALDGNMDYADLRQMIFDYYKENNGIELGSISIDYLQRKLTGEENTQPFFIKYDKNGETRFDISKEEITEILKLYLAKDNYELIDLDFKNTVCFKYKEAEQNLVIENNQNIEQTNEEVKTVEVETKLTNEEVSVKPIPVKEDTLERMAREKRKFTILQRERAMTEAQRGKNQSAIMAGICILGAMVSMHFNNQDPQVIIQHELDSIYSWQALAQYIKDLGPLTTWLSASAVSFIGRYFSHSEKFRKAHNEFIDFNSSLEKENTEQLGGNENAKSR